ncbi:hypothetical protein MMC29_006791 [Sticta canariensis]|nr:hypothetical protein [Sticta canariensis]
MSQDIEHADEQTRLLPHPTVERQPRLQKPDEELGSTGSPSYLNRGGHHRFSTSTEDRLPYNSFVTVDLLRDRVKDSYPHGQSLVRQGLRHRLISTVESCQGWIMAALVGCLTACVAFLVDIAEATVSDWKSGYCWTNVFSTKENCCVNRDAINAEAGDLCEQWHIWVSGFWKSYGVFLGFALSFGMISASATTYLTKVHMPVAASTRAGKHRGNLARQDDEEIGKAMYLAAGSGIPEIRVILSGFVIPHLLDFKVLVVKAFGAVFAVATVLVTVLLQYPNPMTREPGDITFKNILVDCRSGKSWICEMESRKSRSSYLGWLVHGCVAKLVLTTITFGCKVPSGIIIPALDAGAFFGRFVGQWITTLPPGIFAMVGAAAFLAGVSRMTISLCVIMFELTGELEYIVPNMIAILVAKWVADSIEIQGVYDLAQNVQGLPFLDLDHCRGLVQKEHERVEILIPPEQTMREISIDIPKHGMISRNVLDEKLEQLKRRGLIDGGLVLVQNDMLQGYLSEAELESGLNRMGEACGASSPIRLLGPREDGDFDLSVFVDRTPLTISAQAPIEYAIEMFGKLGLCYICVVAEGTGKLVGVIEKKRFLSWLESLKH